MNIRFGRKPCSRLELHLIHEIVEENLHVWQPVVAQNVKVFGRKQVFEKTHNDFMEKNGIHNTRISHITPLPTPAELKAQFPLTEKGRETVLDSRSAIERILLGEDNRLIVVVGPCSVHRMDEVFEYATSLSRLAVNYADQMHVVMRFCGDKPRSGRAWTGWWSDPRMDGSCDIAGGWREGRETMVKILDMGLPLGCELLDAEHFQRVDDLPSYVWLGARNVGGQRERQIASGISAPVGLKNHNTGGSDVAISALDVVITSNVFVASNDRGVSSRFVTTGNRYGHLILRGTEKAPNYDRDSVSAAVASLKHKGHVSRVVVDASHGNSNKDHRRQRDVISDVVGQIVDQGSGSIAGIMYESFLQPGKQPIPQDLSDLIPGVSVTDGCDGWEQTAEVLASIHDRLLSRK